MLRFQPDSWLEGLLRPLLMADPVAGLYFEVAAPDWRFAFLVLLAPIALATGRGQQAPSHAQKVGTIGLVSLMYLWVFVVGNGRYFIWGLLLVGPLLAMTVRRLPGTPSLRLSLLALVFAVQVVALHNSYTANAWGTVEVRNNPIELDSSSLREEPAVFLTMSALTFSILVPRFHPEARWASLGGQHQMLVGSPEHRRLLELLKSPLNKYLVLALDQRAVAPSGLLQPGMTEIAGRTLGPLSLTLDASGCSFLGSSLGRVDNDKPRDGGPPLPGFWICPLNAATAPDSGRPIAQDPAAALIDVFERIERTCPRFFPARSRRPVYADDSVGYFYPSTDVRVLIDHEQQVYFKYYRAMNPTRVGSAAEVRRGEFRLPCDKLPGRYLPPWQRH